MIVRHRAGRHAPSQAQEFFPATHDENESDHYRRQRTLHTSILSRFFLIVGTFALLSVVFSRRKHDVHVRTGSDISSSNFSRGNPRHSENPRVVTIVMPSVVRPEARLVRLTNIAKTWGPAARAVFVVHSANEYPDGAKSLVSTTSIGNPYPQLLLVPDGISVEMGVQRLEHVIRTVHKDMNPDFAFFVNDHTFVIPDNLCKFLKDRDSSIDIYAGHPLKGKQETVFNSGAAGYVLSRSTMEKLIDEWDKPNSKCSASGASQWIQNNPGLLTAKCFAEILKIRVLDTRDKDLSHVFHAFGLVRTVTGSVDQWYLDKHDALDTVLGVDTVHHHKPQAGASCCSPGTVSFHYVEGAEAFAFWEILNTVHSNPSITDDEIKSLMNEIWPRNRESLGFYAHGLPAPNSYGWWKGLVEVVRKIATIADPQKSC